MALLAKLDPLSGEVTPHPTANLTQARGDHMQAGRSTFDHASGVLFFHVRSEHSRGQHLNWPGCGEQASGALRAKDMHRHTGRAGI